MEGERRLKEEGMEVVTMHASEHYTLPPSTSVAAYRWCPRSWPKALHPRPRPCSHWHCLPCHWSLIPHPFNTFPQEVPLPLAAEGSASLITPLQLLALFAIAATTDT